MGHWKFPHRKPFCSSKKLFVVPNHIEVALFSGPRGCTAQYDMSLLCNLMVVGAFSPSTSASVCHSASLCEFLCVVFCISLPYVAAQSRISEFAKSHELKSRPHAMLWLSKVYIIPAGCHDESWYQLKHGLQVWAISIHTHFQTILDAHAGSNPFCLLHNACSE